MKLKRHSVRGVRYNGEEICGGFAYYDADEVDALIAEKDKEIAEKDKDIAYWREEYDKETQLTDALKDEIESLKASHYAEMVDAGMRERSMRRELWIARSMRAMEKIAWFKLWNCSISTMNPDTNDFN